MDGLNTLQGVIAFLTGLSDRVKYTNEYSLENIKDEFVRAVDTLKQYDVGEMERKVEEFTRKYKDLKETLSQSCSLACGVNKGGMPLRPAKEHHYDCPAVFGY